jgi:hypothetical protein
VRNSRDTRNAGRIGLGLGASLILLAGATLWSTNAPPPPAVLGEGAGGARGGGRGARGPPPPPPPPPAYQSPLHAPVTSTIPIPTPIPTLPAAFLPLTLRAYEPPLTHPNPALAADVWRAAERFAALHFGSATFPAYAPNAGGPTAANARINVDAACHDFPDLPDPFGPGAHHQACYEWVAGYLALFHAARARQATTTGRTDVDPGAVAADLRWSQAYLDVKLDELEAFVYGKEDRPEGAASYRDTLAGIWQNPLRAVDVVLIADLLRKQDALGPERQARAEELLSGIARAWYAEFRVAEHGTHPTSGLNLTTAAFPAAPAWSLSGKQVASHVSFTFKWDADKGNSPSEEVGWIGTSAMLTGRTMGGRLDDGATLYAAGRHWLDYALVYDRPDPVHGGTIRTLGAETEGGAYGQRRYWVENHTFDVPSMPYLGYTWLSIGTALFASDLGDQAPWPSLVPDAAQWEVLQKSAGETLRAPDGTFLVDWTPGRGIGYNMDPFPNWAMPCGQWIPGRHYVRYDGRAGGEPMYVSEIGHPAGLDLINVAWPMLRIAAHRQDRVAYANWEDRLRRVLVEYTARPINPHWAECQIAPYVSTNPGYHASREMGAFVLAWLGLSGHTVDVWE